ncbi:MAG: 2-deoxy-D-gluconate 3-dehydrogenase [Anaerolineales bacterium]|nr:SDR family oxidoreductase [Anaerolineae bacterium]PWB56214.1 MAG: 2-deoxy-D-gluconate 3-dehydrogenase [Anaerolineales bacterium]
MTTSFSIEGKRAIITGAARGLGRGMAQGLHEAGAELALIDMADNIQAIAKEMGAQGKRVVGVQADLSHRDELKRGFDEAVKALGGLDILVNNAGITRWSQAEAMTEADWDIVLEVNLNSVFFLAQLAGQHMLKQGHGKIVNIASLLSFGGGYLTVGYAASKGGVAQMTKALANEWSGKGINVNAIAPGYMATEMNIPLMEDPARNKLIMDRVPAGRWGLPEDLVGALIFLSSSASDYVHGVLLPVDGAFLAR